jgi:cation diffusion facilitator family transporter
MDKRARKIGIVSFVSLMGNALLSMIKIAVGSISGSLALVADGIDSAGDILTSGIAFYTSRVIARPPNPRFPYGYGKAESIATKVFSFFIFFAGAQMAYAAVQSLSSKRPDLLYSNLAIYVTIFSILSKLLLGRMNIYQGKKHHSSMLKANGLNMQNDVFISLSVLIGLLLSRFLELTWIDSVAALLVSFWIMKIGFAVFMESNLDLMDGQRSPEIYHKIFDIIDHIDGVQHPHRVRVRKIGHKLMIAADIEVDGNITLKAAHDLAFKVEEALKNHIEDVFDVLIHVEPLGDQLNERKIGISRDSISQFWD